MTIKGCTIIVFEGRADHVSLHTDLPETCYPYVGHLSLRFEVAKGKGAEYVKEHFPGVAIEVVDGGGHGDHKFSQREGDA